jgi:hypothetical protein
MPTWNATGAKPGKTGRLRPKPAGAGKAGSKSGPGAKILAAQAPAPRDGLQNGRSGAI